MIADAIRVGYYAIADVNLPDINGVMETIFELETFCGLCPKEVGGEIHLVFRDSLPMEISADEIDLTSLDFGKTLQLRLRNLLKVCERHDAGEISDEQYALWKSKYPLYLSDCVEEKSEPGETVEISETPTGEQQSPKKKRKRKSTTGNETAQFARQAGHLYIIAFLPSTVPQLESTWQAMRSCYKREKVKSQPPLKFDFFLVGDYCPPSPFEQRFTLAAVL